MNKKFKKTICGHNFEIGRAWDLGVGRDGYMWRGNVKMDGKLIGTISNYGDGGCPCLDVNDGSLWNDCLGDIDRQLLKQGECDGLAGVLDMLCADKLDWQDSQK